MPSLLATAKRSLQWSHQNSYIISLCQQRPKIQHFDDNWWYYTVYRTIYCPSAEAKRHSTERGGCIENGEGGDLFYSYIFVYFYEIVNFLYIYIVHFINFYVILQWSKLIYEINTLLTNVDDVQLSSKGNRHVLTINISHLRSSLSRRHDKSGIYCGWDPTDRQTSK